MSKNFSIRVFGSLASIVMIQATVMMQATLPDRTGASVFTVAPNVHVSAALSGLTHSEIASCIDPARPSQSLVGSMFHRENRTNVAVYRSTDNGKSWALAFTMEPDTPTAGDPTCAFDGRGHAYFVAGGKDDNSGAHHLLVYRSDDDGQTWGRPLRLPFLDREWITVPKQFGVAVPVFIHGTAIAPRLGLETITNAVASSDSVVTMLAGMSSQDGEHFDRLENGFSEGKTYIMGMGNGVALPDGAVGVLFGSINDRTAQIAKSRSRDQTLFFAKIAQANGRWAGVRRVSNWVSDLASSGAAIPQLAIDPSGGPFKSRLYAVWADRRSGRVRVLLSWSRDLGLTWSDAEPVDDEPSPFDANQLPDLANPAVAVNRFGVVGVSWLDRRRNARNLDWDYRMAVSLDGGETFSKSVLVSSQGSHFGGNEEWPLNSTAASRSGGGDVRLNVTLNGFFDNSGHTVGMTTDADGAFHPVWADNRTGRPQVWTTTVHVEGTAQSFDEASGLQDVSSRIKVELSDLQFDRKTNVLGVTIRLKNESRERLTRSVLARVLRVNSQIGTASVLDSINQVTGIDAILDLSDALQQGSLEPGQVSNEKRLRFHIDQPNPFVRDEPWLLTFGLLSLRLRIYSAVVEPQTRPSTDTHRPG